MTFPTFKEQYDKLSIAYIHNHIDVWDCTKCFIGNLLNNNPEWGRARNVALGMMNGKGCIDRNSQWIAEARGCVLDQSNGFYTLEEIADLEVVFLNAYEKAGGDRLAYAEKRVTSLDEEALFIAFEKALDHLKQLHTSKGENVDEVPEFKKREMIYAGHFAC